MSRRARTRHAATSSVSPALARQTGSNRFPCDLYVIARVRTPVYELLVNRLTNVCATTYNNNNDNNVVEPVRLMCMQYEISLWRHDESRVTRSGIPDRKFAVTHGHLLRFVILLLSHVLRFKKKINIFICIYIYSF